MLPFAGLSQKPSIARFYFGSLLASTLRISSTLADAQTRPCLTVLAETEQLAAPIAVRVAIMQ
jgi:hypothetical protein